MTNPKDDVLTPARVWVDTLRPKTLFAALSPVLMAGAMAYEDGQFHLLILLVTLSIAMFVQIGTNFCNDVFDHTQGADTDKREGPRRGIQSGRISLQAMSWAAVFCFGMVAVLSALLVARGGWPIVMLAVASIFCGVFYTAGRFSLAYTGLADIFVLFFFGPIATCGTYYLQAPGQGWPPMVVAIAGLGPGFLATGLLSVNNLRDVDEDRESRKMTLAVRFGRGFSRWEYTICLLGSLVVPVVAGLQVGKGAQMMMMGVTLPLMISAVKRVRGGTTGKELNPALGLTGKILLMHAVVFSLLWVWG